MSYLIVGLGNPGKKYDRTRHNFGFACADAMLRDAEAVKIKTKLLAEAWSAKLNGATVYFLKPLTFMNLSGAAVGPFLKEKRIPVKNLIVINDELDLPFGTVRLSVGSGAAGHNGVKSIIENAGTKDFARIRLGVGPRPASTPADKFVLGKFTAAETKQLPQIFEKAAAIVAETIKG